MCILTLTLDYRGEYVTESCECSEDEARARAITAAALGHYGGPKLVEFLILRDETIALLEKVKQ